MTLREIINGGGAKHPLEKAFIIAAYLRTVAQGEVSTYEGECSTILAACKRYGRMDREASVQRWMDEIGVFADIPKPDAFWEAMVLAAERDEQE